MSVAPILVVILAFGIGVGETAHAQQSKDPRVADLVRTGKLRVGVGLGSPSGAMKNPATGELRGLAVDLGRALAARIGVDFVAVEYPRPGAILEGLQTNAWDMAFLVVDPERAKEVDFAPPHMQSDFTYLVPAGSPIQTVADADQPGIRIAAPRGDAVDLRLTRLLKKAELVRTDTISAAVELVRTGGADARAGPRQALLAESDRLPGLRVLAGGFAVISSAASVPKGHAGRLAYIGEFIEEAKASGLMKKMIEDAGLRGVQVAPGGSLWTVLKDEPYLVVLMRHTEPAGGNPLMWDESGNCAGESMLTDNGKAHATRIGEAFASRGIKPIVISSPMCRCRDTAKIAFGDAFITDGALREVASADPDRAKQFERTAQALIRSRRGPVPVVFVSHRPNIDLLTMELVDSGDLLVGRVNDKGEIDVLGKIRVH